MRARSCSTLRRIWMAGGVASIRSRRTRPFAHHIGSSASPRLRSGWPVPSRSSNSPSLRAFWITASIQDVMRAPGGFRVVMLRFLSRSTEGRDGKRNNRRAVGRNWLDSPSQPGVGYAPSRCSVSPGPSSPGSGRVTARRTRSRTVGGSTHRVQHPPHRHAPARAASLCRGSVRSRGSHGNGQLRCSPAGRSWRWLRLQRSTGGWQAQLHRDHPRRPSTLTGRESISHGLPGAPRKAVFVGRENASGQPRREERPCRPRH